MILPDTPCPRSGEFNPPGKSLSEEHRRKQIEGSAIAPDVADARGYWTASRRAELPGFKGYQRRAPALVAPLYSPDGETVSAQLRPENPRLDKKAKPIKYETPGGARNILDVHPFNQTAVRNKAVPLWITEGSKKGDALTSRGRCALVIAGVWNWHLKGGAPLPCWEHVPLSGRSVYVAFDSDWRSNQSVHDALARLVAFLEGRGAAVLVVDVPDIADGKTGIDDYLAAGGDLGELERGAKPYEPTDVATERLGRDEKLRAGIRDLRRRWRDLPTVKQGECTDSNTARELIVRAGCGGKVVKDGIRVRASVRSLALATGTSTRGQLNSLRRLEAGGFLRPDNKDRRREQAGAYILRTNGSELGKQYGGKATPEEKVKSEGEEAIPPVNRECDPGVYLTRSEVPVLRWSRVIVTWRRDRDGNRHCEIDPLVRLGKKRAAIIEHLLESGGTATVAELMEQFASPKTRRWDFRRDTLAMLEGYRFIPAAEKGKGRDKLETGPTIVLVEGDVVSLVHAWREALDTHRSLTEEIDREEMGAVVKGAATLQAEEFARQREAFQRRDDHPADPEPEMPQVDDLGEHWSLHPDKCACRECSEKFGRVIGECVDNCRCARCYTARKEAERKSGVATLPPPRRASAPLRETPATVVSLRPEAEDWRSHELDCECPDCLYPEPKYARPYSRASV